MSTSSVYSIFVLRLYRSISKSRITTTTNNDECSFPITADMLIFTKKYILFFYGTDY